MTTSHRKLAVELCKALGLDPVIVKRFSIRIEHNGVVEVIVEQIAKVEQTQQLVSVVKRYRLVEEE